ncbi:MAG TPA: polymer-forming cytoskeletal protein [Candidatus Acidoferrum sp.]|nr:polymer-forming cytoskeletal protein [Candidatus Acidoferrum sp.]
MADRNPFGPYRLRRVALQLRQFTINELKTAAGVPSHAVHDLLHDLRQEGKTLFETETLASEGPGRPLSRYTLTPEGVEFLASGNVAIAKEFNELAFQENPSLRPRSIKGRNGVVAERPVWRVEPGLTIKGEISGDRDLQIDGRVEGLIELNLSKVTILASAKVTADIIAREVVIYGSVKGNIRASNRIEIKKDGSLNGDVTTARVMIEDGAFFKGSIEIDKSGETRAQDKSQARAAGTYAAAESH